MSPGSLLSRFLIRSALCCRLRSIKPNIVDKFRLINCKKVNKCVLLCAVSVSGYCYFVRLGPSVRASVHVADRGANSKHISILNPETIFEPTKTNKVQ